MARSRRLPAARAHLQCGPVQLSALSISHSKSVSYGAFVWARRALNGPKRWFPARAVGRSHAAALLRPTPDAATPDAYMWGGNSLGQLGSAKAFKPDLATPTLMPWQRVKAVVSPAAAAAAAASKGSWFGGGQGACADDIVARWVVHCDGDNTAFFASE